MTNIRYFLIDQSNSGIIISLDDPFVAHQLQFGKEMLNSSLVIYNDRHNKYNADDTNYSAFILRTKTFKNLSHLLNNDKFNELKRIVSIRARAFYYLRNKINSRRSLEQYQFPINMENVFTDIINNSTIKHPSEDLLEYAEIAGWTVDKAYEYIKLYIETINKRKLNIHAYAQRISDKINICVTEEQIDTVIKEIQAKVSMSEVIK